MKMKKEKKEAFIKKNASKGAKWIAEQLGISANNVYVTASKMKIKLGKPKKVKTAKPADKKNEISLEELKELAGEVEPFCIERLTGLLQERELTLDYFFSIEEEIYEELKKFKA